MNWTKGNDAARRIGLTIAAAALAGAAACMMEPPHAGNRQADQVTVTQPECGAAYQCVSEETRKWMASESGTVTPGRWRVERWQGQRTKGTVITRTERRRARIAESVERATRVNEAWWGAEKETTAWTVIDGTTIGHEKAAVNTGALILIDEKWATPEEREWLASHETAHHWWTGNGPRTDEGMAELTASIATGRRTPARLTLHCGNSNSPTECETLAGAKAAVAAHSADRADFDRAVRKWIGENAKGRKSAAEPPWAMMTTTQTTGGEP